MSRKMRSYRRKKGSPKQKNNLDTINDFLDKLMTVYYKPIDTTTKIKEKNKTRKP